MSGPRAASTRYRLPTDGDHPVRWTIALAAMIGLAVFVFAVRGEGRRRRGLGLPWTVALAMAAVAAVVAAIAYGLWFRRAPRGLALRLDPDGIAFTEGQRERWSIPWAAVTSAGIVHSALPRHRGEPAPSYLRLEVAEGAVPDDPSLHRHEGAWWFALSGFDTAARLHHDLRRRAPDRFRPVEVEARLPHRLASHGPRTEKGRRR